MKNSNLSQEQEKLLVRYFDCEAGPIEKFRARRLLANSKMALKFVASMEQLRNECRQENKSAKTDLWERIDRRIEQEQRAAMFLGKRDFPGQVKEPAEEIAAGSWFSWGLGISGAAVTAGLATLIFVSPNSDNQPAAGSKVAKSSVVANVVATSKPQLINTKIPQVFEVDWMRSRGRAQVIHDPEESGSIIWIGKKHQTKAIKAPQIINSAVPGSIAVGGK